MKTLTKQAKTTLAERQAMLIHRSPVTAQTYEQQLERGMKKYREQIADLLGM